MGFSLSSRLCCLVFIRLFFVGLAASQAQNFAPQPLLGIPDSLNPFSKTYWADFDNDGDLDVLMSEYGIPIQAQPFRNAGGGVFTPVYAPAIRNLVIGAGLWGDFNQDGFLDIFGAQSILNGGTVLYPFDGCRFRSHEVDSLASQQQNATNSTSLAWGDDDQDGDLDAIVLYPPNQEDKLELLILRWQAGRYYEKVTLLKESLSVSGLVWQDYDRDGDLDILFLDQANLPGSKARLLQNQHGTYIEVPSITSAGPLASLQWADVNADGYLDIVAFTTPGAYPDWKDGIEVYLYKNGQYALSYSHYFPLNFYSYFERTLVGDMNNDGRPDIVAVAYVASNWQEDMNLLQVYYNQGNDSFLPVSFARAVPPNSPIPSSLVDYDRDGDLDMAAGNQVLINALQKPKVLPPAVPAGLSASVSGRNVTLSWQAATDGLFPTASLTYNVHVFSSVKGIWLLNGMSQLSTGKRQVLQGGNAGALTHKVLKNLPDGTYFWTVQAINPNLEASAYASMQSFSIHNGNVSASIAIGSLQWLNTCECNQMVMETIPSGTFGADNRFLLQLSDSTGNFANPTTLFENHFGDKAGYHNGLADGKLYGWLPRTVAQGTHYRVRVASTNPALTSADNGYDIAVKKAPQLPGAITTASTTLCINSSDTPFKVNNPALYANYYTWDIQPAQAGVITGNGLQATVNWTDTYYGPVQIRMKGVNGCGEGPYSAPFNLFVRPLPAAAISPRIKEKVCPGKQNVLVETDSVAYAEYYQWILPDGATIRTGTPDNQKAIRLDFADTFAGGTISVVAKSICGQGQPAQSVIEVPGKIAPASQVEGPDRLCIDQGWATYTVPLIANATQYLWTLPDGLSPANGSLITPTNQIEVQVANQLFTGNVSVAGQNDCFTGEAALPLSIQTLQPPAVPSLQGPEQVCPGNPIMRYQVAAIKEAAYYEWILPTGIQAVDGQLLTTAPQLIASIAPDFNGGSIRVKAVNHCGSSAFSPDLLVNPLSFLPAPFITQTCNNLKSEVATYPLQWYFDHHPIVGATNPDLVIDQKGFYTVKVYGPCDTLEASLLAEPVFGNAEEIPNAFTPNGDEINEHFELAGKLQGSQVQIYNRWGELIYQSQNYQNDWQGQGQSTGVYYYYLSNACLTQPVKGTISLLR
jgi:gliding motility-associated-like protein